MAESLVLDKSLSKQQQYESLLPQIFSLISDENNIIAILSNISAALKDSFDSFSWVGFYFLNKNSGELILGPFQGKVACSRLPSGIGVCHAALIKNETVIVEDVHNFEGHIACDSGSNSEIVVPIIYDNEKIGVLDIDSYELNNFDETDKIYLEKLIEKINEKIYLIKKMYN